MSRNKSIFSLLTILLFGTFSCTESPSSKPTNTKANSHPWREMKCGLFMSPEGKIGLASNPETLNADSLDPTIERCDNTFITTFGSYDSIPTSLSAVIDTSTFKEIGASFYKDTNHTYFFYSMCGGGYFYIFNSKPNLFQVIGDCYVKDDSNIYHSRHGKMNADYNSFKTSIGIGPLAKDKNGYFSFEERIDRKNLEENVSPDFLKKLDEL